MKRRDLLREVLGVVLDPAEQRRASGVLPGTGRGSRARATPSRRAGAPRARSRRTPGRRSTSGRLRSRSPRSRCATSSRPPSPKLTVDPPASTARPWSSTPCRRRSARGLEPISVSRPSIRRPIRESIVLRISPVASRYQNRSRPRMRWGSGVCRDPIERWTSCDSDSSSAIWKPVLPPPTTSTGPSGIACRRPVGAAVELGDLRIEALGDRTARSGPGTGRWRPRPGRPRTRGRRARPGSRRRSCESSARGCRARPAGRSGAHSRSDRQRPRPGSGRPSGSPGNGRPGSAS